MKGPGFIYGVVLAFALSALGFITSSLLAGMLPAIDVARVAISVVAVGYGVALVYISRTRAGRVMLPLAVSGLALGAFALTASVSALALIHTLAISVLRVVLFRRNLVTLIVDFALGLLALSAALLALPGSLTLAVWTYFLVQALVCVLAGLGASTRANTINNNCYQSACAQAERALHRLS